MADYTAIDPNALLPGKPLTSPIVTALEENLRAFAEGAVGAPKLQRAAIQNDAVNRSKIDTATNSLSGTLAEGAAPLTVLMDAYSFFPSVSASLQGALEMKSASTSVDGSANNPGFSLTNTAAASINYVVGWRYIEA